MAPQPLAAAGPAAAVPGPPPPWLVCFDFVVCFFCWCAHVHAAAAFFLFGIFLKWWRIVTGRECPSFAPQGAPTCAGGCCLLDLSHKARHARGAQVATTVSHYTAWPCLEHKSAASLLHIMLQGSQLTHHGLPPVSRCSVISTLTPASHAHAHKCLTMARMPVCRTEAQAIARQLTCCVTSHHRLAGALQIDLRIALPHSAPGGTGGRLAHASTQNQRTRA